MGSISEIKSCEMYPGATITRRVILFFHGLVQDKSRGRFEGDRFRNNGSSPTLLHLAISVVDAVSLIDDGSVQLLLHTGMGGSTGIGVK
ncbi:MAG: hypothetical protein ACK53Y_01580, partial [bacterium]